MVRRATAAVLSAAALVAAGCGADGARQAPPPPPPPPEPRSAAEHLRALLEVTEANGGTRASGTPGYDAAVRYVADTLTRAGYQITRQRVGFDYFAERSPVRLRADGRRFRRGRDMRTMEFSGSGRVTDAPVRPIRLGFGAPSDSGCARGDFAGLRRGDVALIQRGSCPFRVKARNAERAGAAAALIANDGLPGRRGAFRSTLDRPGIRIPVLALTTAAGRAIATANAVSLATDTVSERRHADNVLAERPGAGTGGRVTVAGAHLDSVEDGPGANDNGSGVAALLAVAERRTEGGVRFGFWAAEELGLFGSKRYVRSLSRGQRRAIASYVNLDMVASPNPTPFAYGTRRVQPRLARALRGVGLDPRKADLEDNSDQASFIRAGIPAGGLFTGAAEAGRGGKPRDPCYHRRCDDLSNTDLPMLAKMTEALERALRDGVLDRAERRDLDAHDVP